MQIKDLKDTPSYLNTLAQWHHHEWAHLNPDSTLEDRIEKMQAYLEDDFIPSTYIALNDELLGSAAIVENDMDTRPDFSPWLASVYVKPEARNQGVGSKLVLHVMQQAKSHGITLLYLFTPDSEDFYTRLGWRSIEKTSYRSHHVTVMQVAL